MSAERWLALASLGAALVLAVLRLAAMQRGRDAQRRRRRPLDDAPPGD